MRFKDITFCLILISVIASSSLNKCFADTVEKLIADEPPTASKVIVLPIGPAIGAANAVQILTAPLNTGVDASFNGYSSGQETTGRPPNAFDSMDGG